MKTFVALTSIIPVVLGAALAPSSTQTVSSPSSSSATSSAPAATCGASFTYTGVNESGAEFGNQNIPGVLGTDYTWPSPSSIDFFVEQGMNTFRIPFQLERLAPPATGITGAFDATYLSGLKTIVEYVTSKGAFAIFEPHNFMIYNGAQITSAEDFASLWTNLAQEFIDNDHVIFDLMNEPHDMDASVVFAAMQAAVNAIRATGATQLILVEGTSWTGAWSWLTSGNADAFAALTDPLDNVAIEMHQYLDSDGSGTSDQCVSSTIGAERLADATAWLKETGLKGFLGEIGIGSNDQCIQAITGALCSIQESGVWLGWLFWAAGPWWDDYFQSIEPPSGAAISAVLPALLPFVG
ncbi:endoglucanase [Flagelloscypha sp. PMI_526]|nr:endoglucanase [Flagelloscypha sp. PMI_526]